MTLNSVFRREVMRIRSYFSTGFFRLSSAGCERYREPSGTTTAESVQHFALKSFRRVTKYAVSHFIFTTYEILQFGSPDARSSPLGVRVRGAVGGTLSLTKRQMTHGSLEEVL
jgi:hypothetical protein